MNKFIISEKTYALWYDFPFPGLEEKELIFERFYGPYLKNQLEDKIKFWKNHRKYIESKRGIKGVVNYLGIKIPKKQSTNPIDSSNPDITEPNSFSYEYSTHFLIK